MTNAISTLDLPGLPKLRSGKVREIFDLGDVLLFVATDRISAFDVILPNPIPDKGRVLTAFSEFWFGKTKHIVANHFLTSDNAEIVGRVTSRGGQPMPAGVSGPTTAASDCDRLERRCSRASVKRREGRGPPRRSFSAKQAVEQRIVGRVTSRRGQLGFQRRPLGSAGLQPQRRIAIA